MAKIDIYTNDVAALSSRLKAISDTIADAESAAGKVQRQLDFRVAAKAGIDSGITKARSRLRKQKTKVTNLSNLTAMSKEEFMNADARMNKAAISIIGQIASPMTNIVHALQSVLVHGLINHHWMIGNHFLGGGSIMQIAGVLPLIPAVKPPAPIRPISEAIASAGTAGVGAIAGGVVGGIVGGPGGFALGGAVGSIIGINVGGAGSGGSGGTVSGAVSGTSGGSVNSSSGTSGAARGGVVATTPAMTTNTHSSKDNAEGAGMHYYTQGKSYNKYWDGNAWKGADGKDYSYKASVSCGICCDAMVASHFGVDMTPGQLLGANGGNASWNGAGVKQEMAKYGITPTTVAKMNASPEEKLSALNQCLANYQNDPAHNSPPMVSIYNKNNANANHYVLVEGKDSDGNYIIIDPANNERTTLKVNSSGYGQAAADKKGYESVIKNVITWTKK